MSVQCPPGTFLTGGGAYVSNSQTMLITDLYPSPSQDPFEGTWISSVRASQGGTFAIPYAQCIN